MPDLPERPPRFRSGSSLRGKEIVDMTIAGLITMSHRMIGALATTPERLAYLTADFASASKLPGQLPRLRAFRNSCHAQSTTDLKNFRNDHSSGTESEKARRAVNRSEAANSKRYPRKIETRFPSLTDLSFMLLVLFLLYYLMSCLLVTYKYIKLYPRMRKDEGVTRFPRCFVGHFQFRFISLLSCPVL